jgi:hypothetical protein
MSLLLRESTEGDEKIESGLPYAILRLSGRRVGIARATLGIDELDICCRAGAKRHVRDLQHFGGMLCRQPRVLQRPLGAFHRGLCRAQLGTRSQFDIGELNAGRFDRKLALPLRHAPAAAIENRHVEEDERAP